MLTTLAEAIGLVVLVIFLFLQGWRTTIIPAITIPVCLVGTFVFVKIFGFSINTLTLFGITLATGLVVDDAIVVIENIERHIHDFHKSAREAASSALGEVMGAVIATSLVLCTVFVPVALFPGNDRAPLSAVRADDRRVGGDLRVGGADAHAGAVGDPAAQGGEEGRVLPRRDARHRRRSAPPISRCCACWSRWKWTVTLAFVATLALTAWVYIRVPTGFCPTRTRATS